MTSSESTHIPAGGPTLAPAALFLGLFGLTFILHFYQLIRTRSWSLILLVLACCCETVVYAAKIIFVRQQTSPSLTVLSFSTVLSLMAPTLVAASLSIQLGYIVRVCQADKITVLPLGLLSWLLVGGNGLVLLEQIIGSILSSTKGNPATSLALIQHLDIAGLALQLLLLVFLLISAFVFDIRYSAVSRQMRFNERLPWERHIKALYFAAAMLVLLCAVQLIVSVSSSSSRTLAFLQSSEWIIYALNSGPLVLALLVLNWVHPSEIISSLKGRGLISMRLFAFEKPTPTARFTKVFPAGARDGSSSDGGLDGRDGFYMGKENRDSQLTMLLPAASESRLQLLPPVWSPGRDIRKDEGTSGLPSPCPSPFTQSTAHTLVASPQPSLDRENSSYYNYNNGASGKLLWSGPPTPAIRTSFTVSRAMSWQTLNGSSTQELLAIYDEQSPLRQRPYEFPSPPMAELASYRASLYGQGARRASAFELAELAAGPHSPRLSRSITIFSEPVYAMNSPRPEHAAPEYF